MIKIPRSWPLALVVLLPAIAWAAYLQGQKSVSRGETLRLENDRVRVVEFVLAPGVPMGMHSHPRDRVEITIDGGRVRVTDAEGKTMEADEKPGTVTWSKGSQARHDVVNIGKSAVRAFHVELLK